MSDYRASNVQISMNLDPLIPKPQRTREQWICFRNGERSGRKVQIPIDPKDGGFALVTFDESWADIDTAYEYFVANPDTVDGVGFIVKRTDPFVGINLKYCRNPETGQPTWEAARMISQLNSYTQVSSSGTGYNVFVFGDLFDRDNRCGSVEMYDRCWFFGYTGNHVFDTPVEIKYRQRELTRLYDDTIGVAKGNAFDPIERHEVPEDEFLPERPQDTYKQLKTLATQLEEKEERIDDLEIGLRMRNRSMTQKSIHWIRRRLRDVKRQV